MQALMNRIRRFGGSSSLVRDERGLSTVEYVILLVIVAVLAIGTWQKFGSKVRENIDDSSTQIEGLKNGEGSGATD